MIDKNNIPEWFELWKTIDEFWVENDCYVQKRIFSKDDIFFDLKNGSNDLKGFEFSDIEIGDVITARVFGGNPYAQMVLQAKATESMFRKMAGMWTPEDDAVIEKKNQVMTAVNQIRSLFSLSPM